MIKVFVFFVDKLQYNDKGSVTWPSYLVNQHVDMDQAMLSLKDWEQRGQKRKRGCSSVSEKILSQKYVVEAIEAMEYDVQDKEYLFLIKWEGYHFECNTWEPIEHLEGADEILEKFLTEKLSQDVLHATGQKFGVDISAVTDKMLLDVIPNGDLTNIPKKVIAQRQLLKFLNTHVHPHYNRKLEHGRKALLTYLLILKRELQLTSIRRWEEIVNRMDRSDAVITVENNVDLEFPPDNFCYINDYVATSNIEISDNPEVHCECKECGPRIKSCCGKQDRGGFTYTKNRKVNVNPGTAIYECNKLCKCDKNCPNRVVQQGRKVPLCIFRTSNGCGWGVKVLRKVGCGEFICEYVGEVIDYEEAERRGKHYNAEGRTYLFDLDYNSSDNLYTIDAATYGNVSHFINHSCDPNLGVYATWINCLNPNLPKLALFALREIRKGEELSFDYMMNIDHPASKTPEKGRPKLDTPEKGTVTTDRPSCKCSADNCRRYLF